MRKKALKKSRIVKLARNMDPDRVTLHLKKHGYRAVYANAIVTNAPKSKLRGFLK